ncbi:MAG TPA: TolC family outer membrane protein [Burkholderiaceae bacterium]|nr:TolC family outer membrane protein [Burkholderiaceae bacterium]
MKARLSPLISGALALAFVGHSSAQAMDLAQAYRDALANDTIVASTRAQLEATRERVPQARAGLLPAINGSMVVNRQMVDTNLAPRRDFTSQNYSVNMTYPLYRLQNVETFEQSKLQVLISEAALAQAQQDLAVRVSQAYFDVLAAQDNLATIRAQKRAISEQLASARRNFEVGTATITDQQEAQSRFDLAVAQEFVAINDLAVKRAALSQLVGKPTGELQVLRKGLTLDSPTPAVEREWTENARQNSLLVQQARVGVEVARREIEKQRYGHRPTVDLVSTLGQSRSAAVNFLGVVSNAATLGVQVAIPIYAGGAVDARVREAASLRDKAESDLENVRRQVEQSARQSYLGVNSGLAQVRALEAAERSSQLALDSNLLGYQVGVRINIDVLNAQQQLFNTQRDLAKARYDVLLNSLRLKFSNAALSEADLQALAALLETPVGDPTEPPPAPSTGNTQVTPVAPRPARIPGGRGG